LNLRSLAAGTGGAKDFPKIRGVGMLKLRNLTKVYRTTEIETSALRDVNIEIAKGEFVAIMGPSGCGKSTLLNVIGMLDSPSGGEYWFDGRNIAGCDESEVSDVRKSAIGFVFQSFNLIDELTVYENVELPLAYNGVSASERKQRVDAMLEKMHIAHRAKHFPVQLSGGQQQRVAVARAAVMKPKCILADEPTGNLDSENGAEVMSLLRQLNQEGSTIVMVTHSEHDAGFASRVVRMLDGKILPAAA
jgi:putative ABC transport system ATP-binding protein